MGKKIAILAPLLLAFGLSCQKEDKDEKVLSEKRVDVGIEVLGASLTGEGSAENPQEFRGLKPILFSVQLTGVSEGFDAGGIKDILLFTRKDDKEDIAASMDALSFVVKEGSLLEVKIDPRKLSYDGGLYELSFIEGDFGENYTYKGSGSSISFFAPPVIRNLIGYSFEDDAAQISESAVSLSASEIADIEGVEASFQRSYNGLENIKALFKEYVDGERSDEDTRFFAAKLIGEKKFLQCGFEKECAQDSRDLSSKEALFSFYEEVVDGLKEQRDRFAKKIYFSFPVSINNLRYERKTSFEDSDKLTLTLQSGEERELDPTVIQKMASEFEISYLFQLKSGLVATPVPKEINKAAPVSVSILDLEVAKINVLVHRVWVEIMFRQNPEKQELLRFHIPGEKVIDLDDGISLKPGFSRNISITK